MRLSIDITPEQHQFLKAAAAIKGESIKEYVLKRTLPDLSEQEALKKLESFLTNRIEKANTEKLSDKTVSEIFDKVLVESK